VPKQVFGNGPVKQAKNSQDLQLGSLLEQALVSSEHTLGAVRDAV
jgi:hypothetical protein